MLRFMVERWSLDGQPGELEPPEVSTVVLDRLAEKVFFTCLESDRGRVIMFATNGERAMLVLLEGEGDAGEHAVDPSASGVSGGFVLDNGQVDEYENRDTVVLVEGLRILQQLVAVGVPPADTAWEVDR